MQLGTYRLISRLGVGGMGEVWRAEDLKLLRQVAIKILPEQLAADPEWKDRFLREARTVAQLNHPNIATIYSIDQQDETLFIAMELIEGEALSAAIARGPMTHAEIVRVGAHVADGLAEAHAKGIVHRDVKPENIIIAPRLVKVLDFGIAKQLNAAADAALTQGGMVVGTPHYMSPEQALGRAIDARTDIFSLGVVLYEMISGQKPFVGEAVTEILLKIVMSEPLDIAEAAPGAPASLLEIVRRCMRKQPDERYRDCDEVRAALEKSLRDRGHGQSGVRTVQFAPESPAAPSQSPSFRPASTPQRDTHPSGTPAQPSKPSPQRSSPAIRPPAVSKPAAPRFRALIADDDPATRYILGTILSEHQIAFDEAENGADAVKLLKSNEYGLVFIDLLMPRIDGWGVIDYLRTRRSPRPSRVFIVTGVNDQKLSTADQDIVSGMVYKPINVQQIEQLVTA